MRCIDEDLNRCFPGDPDGCYEERLAFRILEEIEGLKVLDLHSTRSHPEPFGFFIDSGIETIEKCGVDKAVNLSYLPETMMNYMEGISIECGHVGTEKAAENAYQVVLNFLASQDVIPREPETVDAEVFEIFGSAEGSDFRFTAENFSKVEEGEVYARNGSKVRKAEQDFVPLVMSTDGYDDMIGFKGRRVTHRQM